jgi:hypothetical protein
MPGNQRAVARAAARFAGRSCEWRTQISPLSRFTAHHVRRAKSLAEIQTEKHKAAPFGIVTARF